jgi:hypothetical protein
MKKILSVALVILSLCLVLDFRTKAYGFLFDTVFQLTFEDDYVDQTPLYYRTVYIYNGDYEFKSAPGFDLYPYGDEAQKRHWLLQTVKTDGRGKFTLNADDIKANKIYLRVGPSYRLIAIEKSSDLSHTPSGHHLRIVGFEKGSTRVNRNDIYDLKKGTRTVIGTDGRRGEEPFKNVDIKVQKEQE